MSSHWCRRLLALATCFVLVVPALALREPRGLALPADFDRRFEVHDAAAESVLGASRAAAAAQFAARFGPDVRLHWGGLSSRPQLALRRGGNLAWLEIGDTRETARAARAFLRAHRDLFGLKDQEIDALETVKLYRTEQTGVTHLALDQRIGGRRVFEGRVTLHLDRRGGLVNVGGEFFPGIVNDDEPVVGPETALQIAAGGIGLSGRVPPVVSERSDPERETIFEAGGEYLERPAARLVVVPLGAGQSRLAWDVSVWETVTGGSNLYQVLVDATNGEPIVRRRQTRYVVDPSLAVGSVFEQDPSVADRVQLSFAGDPIASPLGWVTADQTLTRGNNVESRSDREGSNSPANPMADGGDSLDFSFTFSDRYAQRGRIADEDAAIAQGFYFGNLYHDYFYALGFDEPAGNYQIDNFGRGGVGGDHIDVDVQDSWNNNFPFFRNNANFSPTVDGVPGRTQYYLFTEPPRDSAFDGEVYFHEFTHGMSSRLVGGPGSVCLSGAQPGGMGEGWGDFIAISYFSSASDDPAGPSALGEYVTGDLTNGIRRYPYHHDMAVNPLTYADLCDGGSCAVHDEGEIWSAALWDARHDLILAHGYSVGRQRIEQIVVDAMKMSPCNPNMVAMRDLIIQASEIRHGGADVCTLRAAFARRGLGASASSVGSGANASAAFDLTARLGPSLDVAADGQSFTWAARPDAVAYPVARGTIDGAGANTFDNATCIVESLAASYVDAQSPAAGGGFFYLVSVRDACGAADFGLDSAGSLRAVAACP